MGAQRLISRWRALALVLACAGCGGAAASLRARPVAEPSRPHHVEIVHAMKADARRALVERLRERNRSPSGGAWVVNEEALTRSLAVVDPFTGFLRRARREPFARPAREAPIDDVEAAAQARAFVRRNADLLGLPRHVVPALAEHVRRVAPADHASPRATWAVRFEAPFATRGYEGFKELENAADLEVFVDDDGEPSAFVNVSRIHPLLTIDMRPGLASDDPRLLAHVVGRRLFALEGASDRPQDLASERALRRVPLGEARADDVTYVRLVVHESLGPQLAWLTYRLAYFVELAKPLPEAESQEERPGAPVFFFRYLLDADTGEVVEDARVPFTESASDGPR